MRFNFKIFAKHRTSEKVLISCSQEQCREIQQKLNDKYGGEWVLVDSIDPFFEILHFDDGFVYNGFNPSIERYSTAIDSITENSYPIGDITTLLEKNKRIAIVGPGMDNSLFKAALDAAEQIGKNAMIVGVDIASGSDIFSERFIESMPPMKIRDELALSPKDALYTPDLTENNQPFYMGALNKKGGKKSKKGKRK